MLLLLLLLLLLRLLLPLMIFFSNLRTLAVTILFQTSTRIYRHNARTYTSTQTRTNTHEIPWSSCLGDLYSRHRYSLAMIHCSNDP